MNCVGAVMALASRDKTGATVDVAVINPPLVKPRLVPDLGACSTRGMTKRRPRHRHGGSRSSLLASRARGRRRPGGPRAVAVVGSAGRRLAAAACAWERARYT